MLPDLPSIFRLSILFLGPVSTFSEFLVQALKISVQYASYVHF